MYCKIRRCCEEFIANKRGDDCLPEGHSKQVIAYMASQIRELRQDIAEKPDVGQKVRDEDKIETVSVAQPAQHVFEVGRGGTGWWQRRKGQDLGGG